MTQLEQQHDESPLDDAELLEVTIPTLPGANRRAWGLWLEVFAVLALTQPLYGGHSLARLVIGTLGFHNTAANFYLPSIVHDAFAAFVILSAMRLSGDPWSAFGISKPTALDLFTGGIVCVVDIGVTTMGVSIFTDILKSMYDERDFYQLIHVPRWRYDAHGWTGLVALLALAISVGLSEELFWRGYLIPRLERLLHSAWVSVLVSAAVFGLSHWKTGILNVCHAFLGGIVYGIAFVWTRRLWPVAIAHAMYDFSAFLFHAG